MPSYTARASKALSKSYKASDIYRNHTATQSMDSTRSLSDKNNIAPHKNAILVNETVIVESRGVGSSDDEGVREWGKSGQFGVPLSEIGKRREVSPSQRDAITRIEEDERFGVKGEDMV